MIKIKDICLINLKSELTKYLDKDKIQDVNVLLDISDELLCEFNKRTITPDNIDKIYNITEYFMIKNNIDFLIKHSTPSNEAYKLLDIELPLFMTIENKNYYNYSVLLEIVEYNLYDWLVFLYQKDCYYDYDLINLPLKKHIEIVKTAIYVKNNEIVFFLLSMGYEVYNFLGYNIRDDAKITNNIPLLDYLDLHIG